MKLLIILMLSLPLWAQAEIFSAKVIVVMDGDTVMVLRDGQKIKIRLANIDAPEKDQPYGMQARQSLLELVGKRQIQVTTQAVDQYGRTVGLISLDRLNVNEEQVRRGMAWEYSHYHSDRAYIVLQSEAQQARRGLWQQTSPQPPWQWRKSHAPSKPAYSQRHQSHLGPSSPKIHSYDVSCGHKKKCSQMTSCDEAHFYLTRCGVTTLDRNHDGVPCEALCQRVNN